MNIDLAISLLISLLSHANEIGTLIRNAQAQGRDITPAELDGLIAKDDIARATLEAAIAKAKGKP